MNNKLDKLKNYFTPSEMRLVFKTDRDNDYEDVADYCNAKLLESGTVVYGYAATPSKFRDWDSRQGSGDTHQGLLIDVQLIEREPCKHEPKTFEEVRNGRTHFNLSKIMCKHCGTELIPTWEAK